MSALRTSKLLPLLSRTRLPLHQPHQPHQHLTCAFTSTPRHALASQFGPPNPTANEPPAHPLNPEPKSKNTGSQTPHGYRPPENPNARANAPYKPTSGGGEGGGYGSSGKQKQGGGGGGYKAESRRVTLALVAAPIALVTSYVLYERVIGGRDKRNLA